MNVGMRVAQKRSVVRDVIRQTRKIVLPQNIQTCRKPEFVYCLSNRSVRGCTNASQIKSVCLRFVCWFCLWQILFLRWRWLMTVNRRLFSVSVPAIPESNIKKYIYLELLQESWNHVEIITRLQPTSDNTVQPCLHDQGVVYYPNNCFVKRKKIARGCALLRNCSKPLQNVVKFKI